MKPAWAGKVRSPGSGRGVAPDPRGLRDTRYQSAYLFGAVCPRCCIAAGLVLPFANTEAMNAHLPEIARAIAPGAHALLVLDGAGWHGGTRPVVPDNLTLPTLPPYAPEFNPVENVWQYLRSNMRAITVFDGYDAIVDACCAAWNFFANDTQAITSITSRSWAKINLQGRWYHSRPEPQPASGSRRPSPAGVPPAMPCH